MDRYLHFSQQTEVQPASMANALISDRQSSQAWLAMREQACLTLQQHTEALRQLMSQMRGFDHRTSVEMVMLGQARSEALRWLIQRIEREIQQLDKGYREAAQREQFLQDQAGLTAV